VPAYWSNMAASHEKLGNWAEMADAGRNCVKADSKFVKGYFRLATAMKNLKNMAECIKTLESGLGVDSSNSDLKKMKKEVVEMQVSFLFVLSLNSTPYSLTHSPPPSSPFSFPFSPTTQHNTTQHNTTQHNTTQHNTQHNTQRNDQSRNFCSKAQEQMQNGDIAAAFKTLEAASKIDAGNSEVQNMMSKVRPKWEAQEASRKSGLSSTEKLKEAGDERYKGADFEGAIEKYSQCLTKLNDNSSQLALKCLSNRAACFKQISNFDGTIEDCSLVLETDPSNVKALVRRAQAFEAVERYKFALQDVKQVLSTPYDVVGEANYKLCNGMQHRLNRVIAQLKSM